MCAADARFAIAKFLLTIGRLLLHCWYSLGRPVTIGTPMVLSVFGDWFSVPFVKNSQQTVKIATITIGVLIVTCQRRVKRIHKAAQTPLPCETSITCVWAVATARCPWSGLTVCVYMDVHVSGSRSLPRAATLSSTNWWCLQLVYSVNDRHQIFHIFGPQSPTFCSPARTP